MFLNFLISIFIFLSCFFVQANQEELNKRLFQEAVKEGNLTAVKELVEKQGADPNTRDDEGTPLIHFVVDPEVARFFLEKGVDPDSRDSKGRTVLFKHYPTLDIGRVLVETGGANPNARDENGNTPLHHAFWPRHGNFLIRSGAKPFVRNNKGQDPNIVHNYPYFKQLAAEYQKQKTSCEYITESSKIKVTQCGRKHICMAEVSCVFKVGIESLETLTERTFQAVCSSLSNGQCPEANDCVLDRKVMEEETQIRNQPSSSTPSSSSGSTKGVK